MDNVVLPHIVQRDQDLYRKSLYQAQGEALKIVHLDEVVKVDTEQLECQNEVLSKYEMVKPFHNILLIFWIMSIQSFYKL